MKALAIKLLEIQKEVSGISKTSENPFYNSMYFDINQILSILKPELNKRNLLLLQPLDETNEGKPAITTIVIDADSGEELRFTSAITELADAQKMGGSVTYWRRYALQSLFGLEALDDDANGCVKKKVSKPAAKAAKPTTAW